MLPLRLFHLRTTASEVITKVEAECSRIPKDVAKNNVTFIKYFLIFQNTQLTINAIQLIVGMQYKNLT